MRATLFALLAAGGILAGCDSDVTRVGRPYQPDDDEGEGGSNRPATMTQVDVTLACDDFCRGGQPECDIWEGFCETECQSIVFDGCEAPAVALIECLAELSPELCRMWESPCEVELARLADCLPAGACQRGAVTTRNGACSTSGVCGGTVMNQDCYALGEGGYECKCYKGSELVRTCERQQILSCDLQACCGGVAL